MANPLGSAKFAYHAIRLIRDPNRLNEVIMLINSVSRPDLMLEVARKGAETPEGALALRDKPRIRFDLASLSALPPGTLGREFAEHMRRNNLDPDAFPDKPDRSDAEYAQAHLYETHDIWHVVGGFQTDIPGELGLQAFYLAQLPARLPPILLAGGLLRLLLYDFSVCEPMMNAITHGWLLGKQARPLFGVRWDEMWALPLAVVRAKLNIAQA